MSRKFHFTFLAGILRDARQRRGLLRERVHSLLCDAASIVFVFFQVCSGCCPCPSHRGR